jgi:hypothetical protein
MLQSSRILVELARNRLTSYYFGLAVFLVFLKRLVSCLSGLSIYQLDRKSEYLSHLILFHAFQISLLKDAFARNAEQVGIHHSCRSWHSDLEIGV